MNLKNTSQDFNFSDISGKNIEKTPKPNNASEKTPKPNNASEKLSQLKTTLETRAGIGSSAKELLGFNLEKINFLARIGEVSEICNNNTEQFLNICSENLDLKLS